METPQDSETSFIAGAQTSAHARPRLASRGVAAWRRLSARERFLLIVTAYLLLATGAFLAFEWSQDQRERHALAAADLAQAREARGRATASLSRADRAELRALAERSVSGRNLWLARIGLEQRIAATMTQAGMPASEVRVADGVEGDPAAPLLRVEVTGPYVAQPLVRWLRIMAEEPALFVVDRLVIDGSDTAQYQLSLLFAVRPSPETAPR